MARPRKPLALHLAEGSYRADRHEDRLAAPRPEGVPLRPEWLEGEAAAHWDEVVPGLVATRVATAADTPALAMLCHWWGEWRRLRLPPAPGAPPEKTDRVYLCRTAQREWSALASKFGLTPVDRDRLASEPDAQEEGDARLVV